MLIIIRDVSLPGGELKIETEALTPDEWDAAAASVQNQVIAGVYHQIAAQMRAGGPD